MHEEEFTPHTSEVRRWNKYLTDLLDRLVDVQDVSPSDLGEITHMVQELEAREEPGKVALATIREKYAAKNLSEDARERLGIS
jgi:hypothetical protein